MSTKSARTPKKLSVPRSLETIQKEYEQQALNAGQLQYQISVYQAELTTQNEKLRALNNEGAARQKLDKESKVQAEIQEVINEAK